MTDHTPEPSETLKSVMSVLNTQWGVPLTAITRRALADDLPRIKACLDACASIPTEQLGSVADLLKAAKLGPQYMALAHADALNDKNPDLAKLAKSDYETAMAGIKPFLED